MGHIETRSFLFGFILARFQELIPNLDSELDIDIIIPANVDKGTQTVQFAFAGATGLAHMNIIVVSTFISFPLPL